MNTKLSTILLLLCALTFAACGSDKDEEMGGDKPTKVQRLSGRVEKGPFVQGSEVTLSELTADFSQTGKTFRTQTEGALGAFSLTAAMELVSPYAELSVSGFYYNEVRGTLSAAPITLRAVADVSGRSTMNVNLLTHLTRGRTLRLVSEGQSFAKAKAQAGRELLRVFAIDGELSTPENVSIADNNREAGILLAISTILLYEHSDAEFTELLSAFATEFAESGRIVKTSTREAIQRGQAEAHPSDVIEKMKAFYAERGATLQVQDFSKYIDFNGDGVIDANDEEADDEIVPDNKPVEETWFSGENVDAYVNGLYYLATLFATDQFTLEAVRLGRVDGAAYGVNLSNPADSYIRKTWEDGYSLIARLNQGIEGIRRGALDMNLQPVYLSRLLALRSYTYYQLAVLWGNIPYYTDAPGTEIANVEQLTAENVMRHCLDDAAYAVNIIRNNHGGNFAGISKPYFLDRDATKLLLGEIGLTIGDHSWWQDENGIFCFLDNRVDDRHLPLYLERLRQPEIPVYDAHICDLLSQEAYGNSDAASLGVLWMDRAGSIIGVWGTLKRLGVAQTFTGCKDHELLLPIPAAELAANPNMRQNPGY